MGREKKTFYFESFSQKKNAFFCLLGLFLYGIPNLCFAQPLIHSFLKLLKSKKVRLALQTRTGRVLAEDLCRVIYEEHALTFLAKPKSIEELTEFFQRFLKAARSERFSERELEHIFYRLELKTYYEEFSKLGQRVKKLLRKWKRSSTLKLKFQGERTRFLKAALRNYAFHWLKRLQFALREGKTLLPTHMSSFANRLAFYRKNTQSARLFYEDEKFLEKFLIQNYGLKALSIKRTEKEIQEIGRAVLEKKLRAYDLLHLGLGRGEKLLHLAEPFLKKNRTLQVYFQRVFQKLQEAQAIEYALLKKMSRRQLETILKRYEQMGVERPFAITHYALEKCRELDPLLKKMKKWGIVLSKKNPRAYWELHEGILWRHRLKTTLEKQLAQEAEHLRYVLKAKGIQLSTLPISIQNAIEFGVTREKILSSYLALYQSRAPVRWIYRLALRSRILRERLLKNPSVLKALALDGIIKFLLYIALKLKKDHLSGWTYRKAVLVETFTLWFAVACWHLKMAPTTSLFLSPFNPSKNLAFKFRGWLRGLPTHIGQKINEAGIRYGLRKHTVGFVVRGAEYSFIGYVSFQMSHYLLRLLQKNGVPVFKNQKGKIVSWTNKKSSLERYVGYQAKDLIPMWVKLIFENRKRIKKQLQKTYQKYAYTRSNLNYHSHTHLNYRLVSARH